jgi:hypothetical protein
MCLGEKEHEQYWFQALSICFCPICDGVLLKYEINIKLGNKFSVSEIVIVYHLKFHKL